MIKSGKHNMKRKYLHRRTTRHIQYKEYKETKVGQLRWSSSYFNMFSVWNTTVLSSEHLHFHNEFQFSPKLSPSQIIAKVNKKESLTSFSSASNYCLHASCYWHLENPVKGEKTPHKSGWGVCLHARKSTAGPKMDLDNLTCPKFVHCGHGTHIGPARTKGVGSFCTATWFSSWKTF